MENFYDILAKIPEFEIRLSPLDTSLTCRFNKIGQVKLSKIIRSVSNDNAHKTHLESLLRHFKAVMKWSPYKLSYFDMANSSFVLAFITFTNNDDHLDFIRIFDKMPFLNGGYLKAEPNGFTDSQFNVDITCVRFDDQRYGVELFNAEHYIEGIIQNNENSGNQSGSVLLDKRVKRNFTETTSIPSTSLASNEPLSNSDYVLNKKRKLSDFTNVTSLVRQPAIVALGRFERYESFDKSDELSDNDEDSLVRVKKR